jgi:uncharacterized protein YjbI with pentapeptide repeats
MPNTIYRDDLSNLSPQDILNRLNLTNYDLNNSKFINIIFNNTDFSKFNKSDLSKVQFNTVELTKCIFNPVDYNIDTDINNGFTNCSLIRFNINIFIKIYL